MEQTKIYTAITHDPSEGHSVRYVQLPLGMSAARTYFRSIAKDEKLLGQSSEAKLIAIIPGRHSVGLGDNHDNNKEFHPDGMIL